MKRFVSFFGHRRIWIPAVILVALPGLLVFRAGPEDSGPVVTPLAVVLYVVIAVVLLSLIAQLVTMFVGVDPEVPQLAAQLAAEPDQQRLLTRWMLRARRARNIGGLCGLLAWVFATQLNGDILLLGVGGIALGAMAAELHSVRPQRGPRTATLDVRNLGDYLMDQDRNRMIGVAAVSAILTVVALVTDGWGLPALCGVAALVILGLANLVQRRVASRPRPAVSASLRRADDLARELAIGRGLARPATFFGLALFARGALSLDGTLDGIGAILGVVAWIYAFYLWWSNRRLGLDFLLERSATISEPVLT